MRSFVLSMNNVVNMEGSICFKKYYVVVTRFAHRIVLCVIVIIFDLD